MVVSPASCVRASALAAILSLGVAGCGGGATGPAASVTASPTSATASPTSATASTTSQSSTATTAGIPPADASLDFLFQTRADNGLGVFVSIDGAVHRVDEAAPGDRHKHPLWTADGSQVAFVAEGEWNESGEVVRPSEVWTVDASGEHAKAVIGCECFDLNNPSWSPDGSSVAYVEFDAPAVPGPPSASRIVTVDLTTGSRVVVTESAAGQLVDIPRWSPDGRSLVVSVDRFDAAGNETGSSFGVVDVAGGTLTPLLPFEEFAYAADWNWATGTLVFSVETQEYAVPDPRVSPWDLFEIEPDGTGRRPLTDVGEEWRLLLPMWTSDGALVAATLDTNASEPGGQRPVVVDPTTGEISALRDAGDYARVRPTP